jgi:glycine oxidase
VKTWDAIIAGGGIIGLSLALELRRRGADVLVLDRGEPGREASSAAAGMLAAADPGTPVELRLFAAESARLYPEFVEKLQAASGISVDFRRQGTVVFLESPVCPPGHTRLSVDELKQLEPALQLGGHSAFFLQEDSVDPDLLSQASVKAVRNAGVEIRSHTAVQQMSSQNGNIEVTTQAERFVARVAVNCQGAWAGAPVRPRKGQMCYLQPQNPKSLKPGLLKPGLLSHVVRAPEAYLVPRSSGKILVGATLEDAGFDKFVEAEMVEKLHRAAAVLIPELAAAPVVQSWAGLRPGTPDDLPIMGETETQGIFVSGGHFRNGILLAPVATKVMADLIMGRPSEIDISPFSPARFAAVRG